jgi:histidyl-tRNA synthetase
MKFQAVKGTRDFYPDDVRLRNRIAEAWRRVSLRNGFEEYDSPIFEYLDLFTAKSGEGIVSELFSLTDRGGRNLAIRPEMTPSLARMVNARINSLPRPIKWFSIARCCRAEKPQKGRTREFFQWNVDVIGEDSVLADAECVFVVVDFLREMGLTPREAVIRYSSRELLSAVLAGAGVAEGDMIGVMAVLDKRDKLPAEAFEEMLAKAVPDVKARDAIAGYLDMSEVGPGVGVASTARIDEAIGRVGEFNRLLGVLGIADWFRYDSGVIRGLAYYTGIVYEVFDVGRSLRAVGGGGRYDGLLEALGGPKVSATGFGMGDVVLGILLEEKGKLPETPTSLEFFVIDGDGRIDGVMRVVGGLRRRGRSADFSYARRAVGKQLKEANRRRAATALIVEQDQVAAKDLSTGDQGEAMPIDAFLAQFDGGGA